MLSIRDIWEQRFFFNNLGIFDEPMLAKYGPKCTRIIEANLAFPLVRDTYSTYGISKCEVLSVINFKDVFDSLGLTEESKKYCGILPYFGSASSLYQRMPMDLSISPGLWQSYINPFLVCPQSRNYCEAIMDDLLLFTSDKKSHKGKLQDF